MSVLYSHAITMSNCPSFYCSSVCVFRPDAFSWDQVVRLSPVERLNHAFTVAKDQLAIERLLDPEGVILFFCQLPFILVGLFYIKQSVEGVVYTLLSIRAQRS